MTLLQLFEVIQLTTLKKIKEVLNAGEYATVEEWQEAKRKEFDEVNQLILALLLASRSYMIRIIQQTADKSYQEITDHITDNWGDGEITEWKPEWENQTFNFLNTFVLMWLASSRNRFGSVERQFREVIAEMDNYDEVTPEAIDDVMLDVFIIGLSSGYVDRNSHRWALDRYLQNLEHQLSYHIWQTVLEGTLLERNIELVQVPVLPDPRQACSGLQSSPGAVICIVPRAEAKAESQQYANIHDPEHRYLEMGGHHGADGNCRHIWTAIGKSSSNLYDRIDRERLEMREIRRQRQVLIKGNN